MLTAANWATCGYSAELLAVRILISWKVSISPENPLAVFREEIISLTEMPSAVKLLAVSRAPFTSKPEALCTPAVTLVMLAQPRPMVERGSWPKSRAVLRFESVAVSVSTCVTPPSTVTVVVTSPTSRRTSTRLIWAEARSTRVCSKVLNPLMATVTR